MICSLFYFFSVLSFDTDLTAQEFNDVIDLRPAESALAMKTESLINRWINDHCLENHRC